MKIANAKLKAELKPAELKATPGGSLQLTAAAAAESGGPVSFVLDAYSGGVMFPELAGIDWRGPVVVDLAGIEIGGEAIPVHRDHDRSRPVGHCQPTIEAGHVIAPGVFSIPGEDSQEIIDGAKNQFPWKSSIGTSGLQVERIAAGKTVEVNARSFQGPILIVRRCHLDEISIVSVAGDSETNAAIAAKRNQTENTNVNFSQWLIDNGHDIATLTAEQLDSLLAEYNAMKSEDEAAEAEAAAAAETAATASRSNATAANASRRTNGASGRAVAVDLTASRQAIADETDRVDAINAIGETIGNPTMEGGSRLVAHAIREGWSVQQTTLYARRHSRPQAPAIHSTSQANRCTPEALQAAILLRAGRRVDMVMPASPYLPDWITRPLNDPQRDRIMNASHEFRNGSLMAFVERSLIANGQTVPVGDNRHAVLRAAFSTNSVQAVFNQSIGSIALQAYAEAQDFSRGWTSSTDALNLLESERPRLRAVPSLSHHPTGGPGNNVGREATSETAKADRYSNFCKIDENDFINDNFQLLAETPRDFGRAAARLVPELVAAVLLRNANLKRTGRPLFNTTDKNRLTSLPLSLTNLQTARTTLAMMQDGDATLNLPTTHLIVPSTLGDLAVRLTQSASVSNDSGLGDLNPIYSRSVVAVEEARLANGMPDPITKALLAGSLSTWYIVSAEGKTIEVQYLQGTGRQPVVEVNQTISGGEFGMEISVKHFAGASALDCLSMIRCEA